MKNWQKLALLAAAAAATAGTGGAAAPVVATGTGVGTGAVAGGTVAGTGVTGGLLGTGAGATGTTATGTGLLSAAHPLIGTGETGLLSPSVTGGMGLSAGTFNPALFGDGGIGGTRAAMDTAGGLFGSGVTGKDIMGGIDNTGKAMLVANAANNLFPHAQQPANMSQGNPAGPQTVAQLYQASQQAVQDQINQAMQERLQRRKIWG